MRAPRTAARRAGAEPAGAGGPVGAVGATRAGGAVAAGGTVGAVGAATAGGAVAAGGIVGATRPGGAVAAGGTDAAGGLMAAGGLVTSGTESKVSGQLEIGSEVAAGVESDALRLIVEDGGQAGIACSVGGSWGPTPGSSRHAPWREA